MPPRSRFAALRTAVLAVPGDGWHLPTPCEGWTVTQVFQHAVGDQIGYAAALTGGPGPGFDPFAPSGDLAGADPAAALEDAVSRAASAWAGADRNAAELPVPLRPRGAYVTALAPAPGDDEVAVLLRYLGRDPHWSAA
nr:maleylpyruvate isomerase N-terminal domain-containing protein [Streptomyces sp. ST1020]